MLKIWLICTVFCVFLFIADDAEGLFPVEITELDGDIQISVPYSFILPTFGPTFQGTSRRLRRSAGIFDPDSPEGQGFSRLNSLFTGMGLDDPECHKRLLCLVSQNPHKYSPLTEIAFQHLDSRLGDRMVITNDTLPGHLMFYEYYQTGKKGFYPETDCYQETESCRSDPDTVIDWNKMRIYQLLKQFLNVSFK